MRAFDELERATSLKDNHGASRVANLGTHASIPTVPGLADARPLTNIEALDLERLPTASSASP